MNVTISENQSYWNCRSVNFPTSSSRSFSEVTSLNSAATFFKGCIWRCIPSQRRDAVQFSRLHQMCPSIDKKKNDGSFPAQPILGFSGCWWWRGNGPSNWRDVRWLSVEKTKGIRTFSSCHTSALLRGSSKGGSSWRHQSRKASEGKTISFWFRLWDADTMLEVAS